MSTYCAVTDLLLGDMTVGPNANLERYVRDGADEIDSRLGFRYILPLSGLAAHERLLLKRINVLLASGRFLMAIAEGGDDASVSAYGMGLLKEARNLLDQLSNGQIELSATKVATAAGGSGPGIFQQDETSPVDAFYDTFMAGKPRTWEPGTTIS